MRKFTLCLMLLSAIFATAQDFANCYVTFTNVQKDGKEFVLYINDSNQLATSTDASVATEFLCTKEASGKYSFYNAEKGLYMIWRNNGSDGYDNGDGTMATYNATYCDWTLSPISGEDCYVVYSKRSNGKDGSLILNHDTGVFDGWDSSASNRSDFSNHFRINIKSCVQFPEDGKAYVIKNVQNNGKEYVLQKGASALEIADVPAEITDAQIFVARVVDAETNKYAFVNAANGEYTMFHAIAATNPFSNGFSTTFAYNENVECHFVVEYEGKIRKNTFSLSGLRNRLTDASRGYATMAIGRDNKQMNANSGIGNAAYSDSYSSLFTFEEVEYANTPKLNSVGTSALITSDLHNKAMATFSAPFATVVPEGVTAYYATDGNGYITLNALDGGKAIPANTGVILVADNAGTIAMSPAAGEEEADNSNNVLSSSAGAAKEIVAGCYVLSAKNGVAGFYPTTAGTIAKNKAYIETAGGQSAIEVRLPGTTGVEKVEIGNEKSEIYDLTGRRVEEITEPGIYIVNGVKKLVR